MPTRTLTTFLTLVPVVAVIAGAALYLRADAGSHESAVLATEGQSREADRRASTASLPPGDTAIEPSGSPSRSAATGGTIARARASSDRSRVSPFPTLRSDAETRDSTTAGLSESPNAAAPAPDSRAIETGPGAIPQTGLASTSPVTFAPAAASVPAANTPRKLPLPLIFQDLDPEAPGLSPAQSEILNSLRADFVRDIGGPQQNAHDPRYADRWRQLQPRYDENLRLFFGAGFAEQVALQAAQADYAAAHPQ